MGGAVMLLIAATVGITYGWTPDGGPGVKYIIQIPADQVEQVVRNGEIASRIPPEIQGHVSEVVVRIGNGSLPRVTPSHLARADYQATDYQATADRSPLPIPAMNSPMELSPIRNPDAATAMMKPAPQGGGMNLPGSLGVSQSNTTRPSTNPLTAPPPMSSASNGPTGSGFDVNPQPTARDGLGNAVDAARSSINGAVASDDPRSRLSQPGATNSQTSASQSSVNQFGGNSTGPKLPPSTYPTNSSARNTASTSQSDQEWYDLRNGSRRRPSTDPIDANVASSNQDSSRSPSLFDNSNFGRLPSGLQTNASQASSRQTDPSQTDALNRNTNTQNASAGQSGAQTNPRNDYGDASRYGTDRSSNLDYDPKLSTAEAQRLPVNGYSFDSQGYPIDRQGYRLNRFGQRIEDPSRTTVANNDRSDGYDSTNRYPAGSNLSDANRNQPAYNTRNGTSSPNGGNSSLVQPPLAPAPGQTAATGPYPPGNYATANNPYGYPANNTSGMYPQYSDPRNSDPRYSDPRYTQLVGGPSATANPNLPSGLAPIGDQPGRPSSPARTDADEEPRSSSDATGATTANRYREALQNPDQVAAQPIFNAMLLLSVVTNAYLLYWLKNLRLQFRDTVAAKRSSNNTGSLAATV